MTESVPSTTAPRSNAGRPRWASLRLFRRHSRAARELCDLAEAYLEPDQVRTIHRAYLFGAEAHEGQLRASGEDYIHHPLQVARILVELRLDLPTIIAAVLHDVIEDTETAKVQIVAEFGTEVAELVDGVSKLTQISFRSKAEAQAENFRKMFLAMAKDIRVILVKLADRLHNMRTLDALPPVKRRQIARETLEIYAPISNRLGLNNLRLELEELGFKALYPMRYRVLTAERKRMRGHRKQAVRKIETSIKRRLRQEGLKGRVEGRQKHLYSLYRKMHDQKLSFSEVFDVYAFRIVVDSVDTCYRALGIMHNLYKPVPGKFKDYVALPKANGYQSLHIVLFGPFGAPIEVQIRTEDMHLVAENGIAAHWAYKNDESGSSAAEQRARDWIKELLEMQQHAGDSIEFIDAVKVDLFPKEIYVFTPAGDIMELPRGATAVDLAYAVHTDVGNTCIAVKIDGRYAPLRTLLATGQNVEVVTAPWGRPNANWLNFVTTAKARSAIRNYLKNLQQGEAVELGRRLLTQFLATESTALEDIPPNHIEALLNELKLTSFDALLAEIGLGKRPAILVTRRLIPAKEGETVDRASAQPILIKGSEGMVVNLGKCCHPIPGDPILGFVSAGRGVVIHTTTCRNIAEYAGRPEKWVDVEWEAEVEGDFPVEIRVDTENRKGVLATVAASISAAGANIEHVHMENREGAHASLNFVLGVRDRTHLARVLRQIRPVPEVVRITRTG